MEKTLSQFWKRKCYKDGYSPKCKDCSPKEKESKIKWRTNNPTASTIWARNNPNKVKEQALKSRLKRLYNMTLEEYNTLLISQNYSCKICGKSSEEENKALSVDHCHINGKVRGLLCDRCNKFIGAMNDDAALINRCVKYLIEEPTIYVANLENIKRR